MRISVLMAAHHSDLQIADALASIRQQRHPDWELLVVEYGSADNTRLLVEAFGTLTGRPVTHLTLGQNHGAASARNRLLELATGEGVAFLDPSDRWMPHHLTNAALRLLADVDVVVSDVRIERRPRPLEVVAASPQLALNPIRTLFVSDALPVVSAEARDFWLRGALQGARFACTQHVTCRSVRPPDPDPAQLLLLAEQRVQFYEKHRDLPAIPAALRRRLLSASLVTKGRLVRATDPAGAAQYFLRAWSLQPMHVQTLGQLALSGVRPRAGSPTVRGD